MPLAWVGLAALAYSLDVDLPRPRGRDATAANEPANRGRLFEGIGRGLAFGFGANVVLLRFIPRVIVRFTPLPLAAGLLALALLALVQAAPWGLAAIIRGALARARVPRPVAFTLAVYLSTFVPTIFPWTPAGGITPWPEMTQLAEYAGERGVTALIALTAALLADAIGARVQGGPRRRGLARLGLAAAIPLAMALQGSARMRAIDALRARAPRVSVGLVDAVVPATTRWEAAAAPGILASLARLTLGAEARGAEVTVWPESAYPYVLPRGSRASPPGAERLLPYGVRGPLLVGAVTRDAKGDQYNAAIAVRSDGVLTSEYDKLHLLWFGEEVPFASELPFIRRTFARGLGMLPGSAPVLSTLGRVKAGALICFEDVLPEAGREAASLGPNLLINLTNDAWFSGSDEPALHLRLAAMRAIETRRDLVRAVNLGPTSFVEASGRIRDVYDVAVPGALVVTAALMDGGPTLYVRFGDWPWLFTCAAIALVFARTSRTTHRPHKT
jgi:apolipoprotein N-acyltransferase